MSKRLKPNKSARAEFLGPKARASASFSVQIYINTRQMLNKEFGLVLLSFLSPCTSVHSYLPRYN
jgi:hypothetical protein